MNIYQLTNGYWICKFKGPGPMYQCDTLQDAYNLCKSYGMVPIFTDYTKG